MCLTKFAKHQNKWFITLCLLAVVMSLAGCSNKQHNKTVERDIANAKANASPALSALPIIKNYPIPKYTSEQLRSPFQPNVIQLSNENRLKDPLERFPLDALHLVGVITREQQAWALITAPDGKLYQSTVAGYLGQNNGKISAIHAKQIDILEPVNAGNNLKAQHLTLRMNSPTKFAKAK